MKAWAKLAWDWAWLGGIALGAGTALGGRPLIAVLVIWFSLTWLAVQKLVDFSISTGKAGRR